MAVAASSSSGSDRVSLGKRGTEAEANSNSGSSGEAWPQQTELRGIEEVELKAYKASNHKPGREAVQPPQGAAAAIIDSNQ